MRGESVSAEDRRPTLHSVGENEVIEKQISIAKYLYEKLDSLVEDLSQDVVEKVLGMWARAEKMYFEVKYDLALNEWQNIEKTLLK